MAVLVHGLPADAAINRVDGQEWTLIHELLAIAVERVDHWGLAQAYLHSTGKGLPSRSLSIPRPGEGVEPGPDRGNDRAITDPAEIKQFFGSI